MMLAVLILSLVCAVIPAVLFCLNLKAYVEQPPVLPPSEFPAVSILIPARNEAHGIVAALTAALASRDVDFEIVVMDDASTDGTGDLVRALTAVDPRVRLEQAPALPRGWNGKQHACWALANVARHPVLCFVDADVRLGPDCIARMTQFLVAGDNALVSGFPQQITGTFLEWMLLPLIHFVLLGFLPLAKMREGSDPAFAAGCGQFMLVRAESYFACGGHSNIKLTMHDGLRLPRLFRQSGFRTDLADLTPHATCRMYTSAAQVWSGLAKNATEGIADPKRIVPVSLILLLGQVLPFILSIVFVTLAVLALVVLAGCLTCPASAHLNVPRRYVVIGALLIITMTAAWLPRILGVRRFRQDWRSALLHPIGILLLLAVQWYALIRQITGRAVSWKDRAYRAD